MGDYAAPQPEPPRSRIDGLRRLMGTGPFLHESARQSSLRCATGVPSLQTRQCHANANNGPEFRVHVTLLLSVTPEATRRLQGLQIAEVILADRLQAFGKRRRLEIVGQVIEPVPILGLQVNEGLDGIAPALRPAAAVLRASVVNARLLFLTALAETALSLCVAKSNAAIILCYVTTFWIQTF